MGNEVGVIIGALVLALALLVGVLVIDEVATTVQDDAVSTNVNYDVVELKDVDTFVSYNDGTGLRETVWKTTGFAINLTGADDSYVKSNGEITFARDETFSISSWASVGEGAESANMTAISADGRVLIQYLDGNWSAWYYDEGARASYRANVSAPNQPHNLSLITATANQSHFTIYRNSTRGEVIVMDGTTISNATMGATNWNGRLEETRAFDDHTNGSEQTALYNNPVAARPERNRTLRVMYDQPDSGQIAIFADTSIAYSNATFASGFEEQTMQPASNIIGADYEWDKTGPRIRPLKGNELDGFPVAYASYEFESNVAATVKGVSEAFQLAAIVPIIAIALLLFGVISKFS